MAATTTMMLKLSPPFFRPQNFNHFSLKSISVHPLDSYTATPISSVTVKENLYGSAPGSLRTSLKPIPAVNSGLEASISNPKDNAVTVRNAKILVELEDNDKMQVRVDLTGEETQIVFDKVLANLARTAPPVPGFRRQKGDGSINSVSSAVFNVTG